MIEIDFLREREEDKAVSNNQNIFHKFILFFGEKLVVLVFTSVVFGFAFFNFTHIAFSKNEEATFVRPEQSWFTDGVSFAVAQNPQGEELNISHDAVPTPTPTPVPVKKVEASNSDDVWEKLADCESHKNWGANTGNGYYGGLQFSQGAWESAGGTGLPSEASRDEQISRGKMLQAARGWTPWGACSKRLGLL